MTGCLLSARILKHNKKRRGINFSCNTTNSSINIVISIFINISVYISDTNRSAERNRQMAQCSCILFKLFLKYIALIESIYFKGHLALHRIEQRKQKIYQNGRKEKHLTKNSGMKRDLGFKKPDFRYCSIRSIPVYRFVV